MVQWDEKKGQYPPRIWYPPHPYPADSTFSGVKDEGVITQKPKPIPKYGVKERDVATATIWPLIPAIVGAGASFLLLLMTHHKVWMNQETKTEKPKNYNGTPKSRKGSAVLVIYSGIAMAGVSFYVFNVLRAKDGPLIAAFVPVSSAISVLILYFAAAYTLEFQLNPDSFSAENTGDEIVSRLVTFVYFSITTFATAGGDIAPLSNASRILVSMEVLFFVFIFTMGIVFFPQS